MSYALLWVEVLVILLLFTATLAALGARRSGRAARGLLMGVGTVLPAVLLLLALFMAVVPWVVTGETTRWAPVLACMFGAYCIGAVTIRLAGRRANAITGEARVRSWSAGQLGVALLVAVAVLLMTLWNMDVQAQLAIQSTRTEAGAIMASVAPPHIPDQQNAALVYEQAFALLPPKDVWENLTAVDDKADPLSPEVQKLLQEQAKTLDLLRRAADMPGCRFEYDYAHPDMGTLMPGLPGLRKGALLLACAARSKAARGDIHGALEDCSRLYQIAEHAAANPSIVTFMVQLGIRHLADQAVAGVLPRVTDAQQLELLQKLGPGSIVRAARRAIRGEEALGLAMLCDWAAGSDPTAILPEGIPGQTPSLGMSLGMFGRIFLLPTEIREYTAAFRRITEQVGTPYYQVAAKPDGPQRTEGLFAPLIVPSLERNMSAIARTQAVDDCRRIAVAATRYRLEHGGYPSDLGQLVPRYLPALPLDPFDGKPMRMKMTDAGWVIYSIGDDGKDNGGAIFGEDRKAVDYGLLLANRP